MSEESLQDQQSREPTPEEMVEILKLKNQSMQRQLGNKCNEIADLEVQIVSLSQQLQQGAQGSNPMDQPLPPLDIIDDVEVIEN